MRLKRLELQGFKSFAGKAVLDFPQKGVVAIVGPNGSGKSNVIDAVRWLLGEREAKSLRGTTGDDLIFSGTDGKSRVGAASAAIHLERDSGEAGEFAEVVVSRKIFRDGTSQYFLNKDEVRLKDLIDFFAGAKLGARGLTVVNQGASDAFVRATPGERRDMIEEILGLRQYQLKRHEAELKLKSTDINLEKVSATVEELLPRLRLLRRQAAKWEQHAGFTAELRDLEGRYFALKIKELEELEGGLAPKIAALESRLAGKMAELRVLEEGLESLRSERADHAVADGGRERELLNRRASLDRELGRLEARLEFAAAESKSGRSEAELRGALVHARGELARALETEGDEARAILARLIENIDELFNGKKSDAAALRAEIETARAALVKDMERLDGEIQAIRASASAAQKGLADFNSRFEKGFRAVAAKKDELAALERERGSLRLEEERLRFKHEELSGELRQAGRERTDFAAVVLAKMEPDFLHQSQRRMQWLRNELAMIGAIDQSLLAEAKEAENRYEFLSSQSEDLAKAAVDLRSLIADLKEKLRVEFGKSLHDMNDHFNNYFRLMFGGGKAKLALVKRDAAEGIDGAVEEVAGLGIELALPKKGARGLDVLSGGEKSLVSIAALFALVSVASPPFLVLDEIDAALDEQNTKRFASLIKEFSKHTQFILVTHNRATMEAADILYGVTMGLDGASRLLSVKLS
jgi:chromosome segregation protein